MSLIVAIDGPTGSGKSSVAKLVAKANGLTHIDTGAIYRAIAWAAKEKKLDPFDPEAMGQLSAHLPIKLIPSPTGTQVFVNDQVLTDLIRTEEISQLASIVSQHATVRNNLLSLQRTLGEEAVKGAVLEGRDIGTVVFPQAGVKFFLTASEEERAQRRFLELSSKGIKANLEDVLQDLKQRDARDKHRQIAPLQAAPDAILLDTTHLPQKEVVETITRHIQSLI